MAMNEVDAALERWEKQGDELKEKLQAERTSLLEKLAKIDEALVKLGCTPVPVKRPYKARAPREVVKLANDDDFAIPPPAPNIPPAPPGDAIAVALHGLSPWWNEIGSGRDRKVVELRAAGKLPGEIATEMRLDRSIVAGIIFRMRGVLQAAREARPRSPAKPAADADSEAD